MLTSIIRRLGLAIVSVAAVACGTPAAMTDAGVTATDGDVPNADAQILGVDASVPDTGVSGADAAVPDAGVSGADAAGPCAAGTALVAGACEPCAVGVYCAGGDADPEPCVGAWDADADPSTACVEWIACARGEAEDAPGSSTSDRTCTADWMRLVDSGENDFAFSAGLGPSGNVYVTGWTYGALPGQVSAGGVDGFIRVYDPSGTELWTRQYGTTTNDYFDALAVDVSGDIYVVGSDGSSAFLTRYDASGDEVWTRSFDAAGSLTEAAALAIAPNGDIVVAGRNFGAFPGATSAGSWDIFVRRFDASGADLWTRQFGSSSWEGANCVGITPTGDVYVAGSTNGALPGQTSAGSLDAFVRKYSATGTALWTRQLGTSGVDSACVIADGEGALIFGQVGAALPGQVGLGGIDGFLRSYGASGAEAWTQQIGTSGGDGATGVARGLDGTLTVLGSTSGGTFPGETSTGSTDAFVATIDASGATLSTRQVGWGAQNQPYALAAGADGPYFVGILDGRDGFLAHLAP